MRLVAGIACASLCVVLGSCRDARVAPGKTSSLDPPARAAGAEAGLAAVDAAPSPAPLDPAQQALSFFESRLRPALLAQPDLDSDLRDTLTNGTANIVSSAPSELGSRVRTWATQPIAVAPGGRPRRVYFGDLSSLRDGSSYVRVSLAVRTDHTPADGAFVVVVIVGDDGPDFALESCEALCG